VVRSIFPDVVARESVGNTRARAGKAFLVEVLVGEPFLALWQEGFLLFRGALLFASFLVLGLLEDRTGGVIRLLFVRFLWSLWCFDCSLELQTAWCVLPDILAGEVVSSKVVRAFERIHGRLRLALLLVFVGKQRLVLPERFQRRM
jgi:hypothetical protein